MALPGLALSYPDIWRINPPDDGIWASISRFSSHSVPKPERANDRSAPHRGLCNRTPG
jgi:hypothetical protein